MLNKIIDELIKEDEEIIEKNKLKKGKKLIIIKSTNDEASQRYIRNKVKKCTENNIESEVIEVQNQIELCKKIEESNNDEEIKNIIVQYPIPKGEKDVQEIFNMIKPEKDIDKLNNCWCYDKNVKHLPITAFGIFRILSKIEKIKEKKILFIGNGLTTNRKLFLYMFDQGYDCQIVNSKTPIERLNSNIEWADILVIGTGKKEWLNVSDKIVICPTIIKTEEGITSELKKECISKNITHNILGKIGKLTTNRIIIESK